MQQLIPRIWADTIAMDMKRSLGASAPMNKLLEEWERAHKRRMAEDPEYARAYEEGQQKWREEMEEYDQMEYCEPWEDE